MGGHTVMNNAWLTSLGLLPLLGALLVSVLPEKNALLIKRAALGTTLVVAATAIVMATKFQRDNVNFQFVEHHQWIPSLGINYAVGVDGIALVLILLSVLLAPIVVLAGWNEALGGRWSVKTFYILMLVLETMTIGVFASTDVFLFYVFFEAMLIPVYFLIGGYGSGARSAAAMKFLIYSLFGGLLMLASIIAIYVLSGEQGGHTFDINALSHLHMSSMTENILFLGFFIAFAIKAPVWPFHTWLPDAAESATPGTSVLLLGVLDKVGTFGMIRYCLTHQDLHPGYLGSGSNFDYLRGFLGDRPDRFQAFDRLHVDLPLRLYYDGNFRNDFTGSIWRDPLYVQSRVLDGGIVLGRRMDEFSARFLNDRRLRWASTRYASDGMGLLLRRHVEFGPTGTFKLRERILGSCRHVHSLSSCCSDWRLRNCVVRVVHLDSGATFVARPSNCW
jgi:hypothetical protein